MPAGCTAGGLDIDPGTSEPGAAGAAERTRDLFLSAVSHELRTPLNAVLGWARLLATGKVPPETVREGLAAIERNAREQVRLLDRLVDAARVLGGRVALESAPVRLAEVVAAAAARNGLVVETTVDADDRPVRGDRTRLEQAVAAVLADAAGWAAGRPVAVRVGHPPGRAVVTVATGGIPADVLPHLFDPSGRSRPGRTGFGLAVARRLVEQHGGTLTAAGDESGRGAAFTLTLPATGAD